MMIFKLTSPNILDYWLRMLFNKPKCINVFIKPLIFDKEVIELPVASFH